MLHTSQRFSFTYSLCLLVAALLTLGACGGRQAAPTLPNGQRLSILVFLDRTVAPETPPEKVQQLQQVHDFMEPDLLSLLRNAGYDAAAVSGIDAAGAAAPGRYILRVQVLSYNAGSKAARMFVGFGAGSARLDSHFELIGPGNQSYVSGSPGVATGRTDWQRVVRKVNQEIIAAVNLRLRQGL